jgi:hypothetical protein
MAKKNFTPDQLQAIAYLGVPKSDRWLRDEEGNKVKQLKTFHDVCEALQIHRNTLLQWRQDEDFDKSVKEYAIKYTTKDAPEVFAAITKQAINGSGKHAELFMKIHGVSREEKTVHNIHEHKNLNPDELRQKAMKYANSEEVAH